MKRVFGPKALFDFGNDSALLRPGLGLIESLCEHPNRMFLLIEPLRGLLDKRFDLSEQGRERIKSQNIFHVVIFTKVKNLRTGIIGISPQNNANLRPGLSDFFDHPLEDGNDLLARRPLPRPQDCCYQFATLPLIDVDGHIAVVAVIGIENTS